MSTKIKYSYCNVCKHEVENPSKKPLTRMQITIWVIVMVATIGLAAVIFAIYYSTRPKDYCPECHTKLVKSDKPFEKAKKKPEDMTAKEKILDKAEVEGAKSKKKAAKKKPPEEESEDEEEILCPYCGEELKKKYPTCPFCQSVLD
ncbi:MAG: hypothetical protein ACW972_05350 [Promethearchaeota archaeon]|jgi:hypothetical protein